MIFWEIDIKSDGGCYKWSFFKWKFKFCYKFGQTPQGFVHNLPMGRELDFQSQPYFFTPSTVSSTKIPTWFDQILIRIGNFSGRVPSSSMVSTDVHKLITFNQKFTSLRDRSCAWVLMKYTSRGPLKVICVWMWLTWCYPDTSTHDPTERIRHPRHILIHSIMIFI